MLLHYVDAAVDVSPQRPILIDKFLENAIEAEADAIADGTDAFVPAVMEHIELAGVHSGDSACVIPPTTIPSIVGQLFGSIYNPNVIWDEYSHRVSQAEASPEPIRVHSGGDGPKVEVVSRRSAPRPAPEAAATPERDE